MPFPVCLLVVEAVVDPSIEEAWNRWYDEVHLPEIVDCPGFARSARYCMEEGEGKRRYIALYEMESEEALRSPEFSQRRGWGPFTGQVEASVRAYRRITSLGEEERGDGKGK